MAYLYNCSVHTSGVSRVCLRGVSKSRKFKWLVKVGASKGVTPDLKKIMAGGGFRATKKPPGYATACGDNVCAAYNIRNMFAGIMRKETLII